LEHADFAALAEAKAAGTLDEAIEAERDRQAAAQLTAPEIAAKLDAVRIRRFVQSEAFAKICAAQQVLRELAFITALPAAEVLAAQGSPAPDTAPEAQVLVRAFTLYKIQFSLKTYCIKSFSILSVNHSFYIGRSING
jgi:ATP-dependent helicase/nuclease subunit A